MNLKKKKKNKNIILLIIVLMLTTIVGVTYTLWTYSRVGKNQELIAGNIYMKYSGNNANLNIQGAMPKENSSEGDAYFEFKIEGENTYNKPIWYEIVLSEGDAPDKERTKRIKPEYLLFKLVEIEGDTEEIIFDRMSYPDLNNKSIWVDTIPANEDEISKTYKLYMWISPLVKLGSGIDIDYDMGTWSDKVFGSVKVTVKGDFKEKEEFSCFSGPVRNVADYNEERTDVEVNACVSVLTGPFDSNLQDGEDYKTFCEGTGTLMGKNIRDLIGGSKDLTFNLSAFNKLIDAGIIKNLREEKEKYDGTNLDFSNFCQKNIVIPSVINKIKVNKITEKAFYNNQLTSVSIPNGITSIDKSAFVGNKFTSVKIPESVTTIGDYAFQSSQLTSVTIPGSVTTIGKLSFYNNKLTSVTISNGVQEIGNHAFWSNQLTSITIPGSVTTIGNLAFADNNLMSINILEGVENIGPSAFSSNNLVKVNIPNSVTTIGEHAFFINKLEEVNIGNGIREIGEQAFSKLIGSTSKSENRNKDLKSITIDKTCSEIKNIPNYSLWLTEALQPTVRKGTTIYGKNGEVCDAY